MSPIRKRDDFRSTHINSWEDVVTEELAHDMAEVDYQNLPDRGKPIKIWRTEVDPSKDLAFSRLKNAGVKPAWMELDQEIAQRTEQLEARLASVERLLRNEIALTNSPSPRSSVESRSLVGRIRRWFRQDFSDEAEPRPTMTSVLTIRDRERSRFLELAAELDKKINDFHNSLPANAQHLQKLRWLPDRAKRVFDERIALSEWWEWAHQESDVE